MAAPMENDRIYEIFTKYMDLQLKNELHITNNSDRLSLLNTLLLNRTIEKVTKCMDEVYTRLLKKKTGDFGAFTFNFFGECGSNFSSFSDQIQMCNPDSHMSDIQAVYNFVMHCVFNAKQQQSFENVNSVEVAHEVSSKKISETERGVMALGGGTLAEIWKVNKKRRNLDSLSEKQKLIADELYKLSLQVRMSKDEKSEVDLPVSTIERDRGGFFIPKQQFLGFIAKTNELVQNFANTESLKKYGRNLIKVCAVEVQSTIQLREMFDSARLQVIAADVDSSVVDEFFHVWVRKIVHARINEFISGHNQKKCESEKKRLKGGQTLRDKLFALTEKKTNVASSAKNKKSIVKSKKNLSHSNSHANQVTEKSVNQHKLSTPDNYVENSTFENDVSVDELLDFAEEIENNYVETESVDSVDKGHDKIDSISSTPATKRRTLKPKRFF